MPGIRVTMGRRLVSHRKLGRTGSTAEALACGGDVTIAGFGRFARTERPAREGRNPRTGERIAIGASSGVSFKAGKALKEALN